MEPILFFNHTLSINPIAVEFGNVKIYWYGIIIVSSILLILFLLKKNKNTYGIKYDDILDFLFGAILFGFLGARIYYVIFKMEYYLQNPSEILKVWHGGIAIYGGIIGAVLYAIYFCKKKKVNFFDLADLLLPYLTLAQCLRQMGKLYK